MPVRVFILIKLHRVSKQFFYPPKKPNQTKLQRHSAQPKQAREEGKWQETGPEIIG